MCAAEPCSEARRWTQCSCRWQAQAPDPRRRPTASRVAPRRGHHGCRCRETLRHCQPTHAGTTGMTRLRLHCAQQARYHVRDAAPSRCWRCFQTVSPGRSADPAPLATWPRHREATLCAHQCHCCPAAVRTLTRAPAVVRYVGDLWARDPRRTATGTRCPAATQYGPSECSPRRGTCLPTQAATTMARHGRCCSECHGSAHAGAGRGGGAECSDCDTHRGTPSAAPRLASSAV